MRISWIVLGFVVLSACKSNSQPVEVEGAPAPTESEKNAAPESAAPAEPAASEEATAPEPATPEPAEAAPAPVPDPDAPANVSAPPADAKRTPSGLAYKVLHKGKGKNHPGKFDTVKIEYTGWTSQGVKFDSSDRHGGALEIPLNRVIPGFAEGVRSMVPGETRRLWIPGKLAYGEEGSDEQLAPTQPLGMLVFDVKLDDFEKVPEPPRAPEDVARIPTDAQKSESGLAWRVLQQGVGTDHPIDTSVVEMSYTMWTADGEVVDSTVLRGTPDTVGISRLVPGWTEGMKMMVEGERRLFWIPEKLAYAGAPHRPPGMVVVDVELVQIRRDMHQVR